MVLEATLICVDNSEWTRNGDFAPTRFEAQQDAANLICGAKTNHHHENAVGILTMAGDRVEVRVTPTNDVGKILSGLHGVKIAGTSDFIRGIQTAQLALKHRMNKNQKQRVVCFVGSPVFASEKQLEQLGKQLKKNNVSLDIVSFGDVESNNEKLQKLHVAVNSNETSHFLECPVGTGQLLSDLVLNSQIVVDADAAASSVASGGPTGGTSGGVNEFGVDPNIDPDLYMALRLSLEEEQARAQREQTTKSGEDVRPSGTPGDVGQTVESDGGNPIAQPTVTEEVGGGGETPTAAAIEGIEGIDDELRQALLMSLQDYGGDPGSPGDKRGGTQVASGDEDVEMLDETAPLLAAANAESQSTPVEDTAVCAENRGTFADPAFMQQILGTLPGVDVNDPRIQEALRNARADGGNHKDEGDEDKEKRGDRK